MLVAELGCKVGSLPSTFLGMPLDAHYNSIATWDGVEEEEIDYLENAIYFQGWECHAN